MLSVGLAFRIARGGGVKSLIRAVLVVTSLALGSAAVLLAYSLPHVVSARNERAAARIPISSDRAPSDAARYAIVEDSLNDRLWRRVLISPGTSPAPPGVRRLPREGESFASPEVIAAARQSDLLQSRLGSVGASVRAEGLVSPDDQVSYTGVPVAELPGGGVPLSDWGLRGKQVAGTKTARVLGGELALLIGIPAFLFLLTCARLNAASRSRSLASLRIAGLDGRQLVSVSRVEAGLLGAVGSTLAVLLYYVAAPVLGGTGVLGVSFYAQDAHLPRSMAILLPVVVGLAAALIAGAGVRRILHNPTASRHIAEPPPANLFRLVPLALGVSGLAAVVVFQQAQGGGIGTSTVNAIVFSTVAAVVGAVLALPLLTRWMARTMRHPHWALPVRLAAHRLLLESSSALRVVTAVGLLVMVGGLGSALLRDARLAAGADFDTYVVVVHGAAVPTDAQRQLLVKLPATVAIASRHSDVQRSPNPGDYAATFGAFEVHARCATVRALVGAGIPQCRDGKSYRLEDAMTDAPPSQLRSGSTLSFNDGAVRTEVPAEVLPVPGLARSNSLPLDSVLIADDAAPAGGWGPSSTFTFLVPSSNARLATFQAALADISPSAQIQLANTNLEQVEDYRVHRGGIRLGLSVGFVVALLTLTVAALDRAIERRPAVAALTVIGVPGRTLRAAQLVQLVAPMALTVLLFGFITQLAAAGYLRGGGLQQGYYSGPLRVGLLMSVVGLLAAAMTGAALPGRRLKAEELRRQ